LLTDDEPPEERAFDYARTVALSDGVFAIGLTLLVLNITLPTLSAGHYGELGSRLLDHRSEFESTRSASRSSRCSGFATTRCFAGWSGSTGD
jgi:Endosomal/lysosomal potassium channel TMEM175